MDRQISEGLDSMSFTGSFELKTPADLFQKLEHDLNRMKNDPLDSYAAFDFFITAEHMIDWLYPNEPDKQSAERKSNQVLLVCSHIANGSKHFKATHPKHKSVTATTVHHGAFSSAFSHAFDITRLEVELRGDAATAMGETVSAFDLATRIRDHWKAKLGL
jgi:hypothetical protein